MRIVFITEHFYPYTGGIAEHTFYLANELSKRHKVYVIAPVYPSSDFIPLPSAPRFEILRIGKATFFPANGSLVAFTYTPLSIWRLRQFLKTNPFDIIHIQGAPVPTLPFFSALAKCQKNASSIKVATFHAQHKKSFGYTLFKPLLKHAFSNLHGGISVSVSAKLTIEKHFNIPNMVIIPNGVDTRRFTPFGRKIDHLADGHYNILFVGRMEPRKGLDILLHALKGMQGQIRLIAVGSGPLVNKYKAMAKKMGINAIFPGKVSPRTLAEYYRTADILVAPSIKGESFGIILLEAMASGLPVIASSVEGYIETLKNGKLGLIFEKENEKELRKVLLFAMNNPDTILKVAQRALFYVKENLSWKKIAKRTEEYYMSLFAMYSPVRNEQLRTSV